MFLIGEAAIDDDVATAGFGCDLPTCKGACCVIAGARGAPLEDDEVLEIEKAYPHARAFLSERHVRAIELQGTYEGRAGDFATTCIDQKECVFVYFEDGIARCSFERAYQDGKTDWRKPISCHLFPVRVRKFGKDFLRYEQLDECEAGRRLGSRQNVKLYEFLADALVRKYGKSWYAEFLEQCRSMVTVPGRVGRAS
jgi:hypothetical protein